MRELRTARAIAHRPHVGRSSFQAVVYFDVVALVELNTDLLQSNAFRIRRPTYGGEEIGTFDVPFTVSVFPIDPNLCARMVLNPRDLSAE
jgi:hypothetical protein